MNSYFKKLGALVSASLAYGADASTHPPEDPDWVDNEVPAAAVLNTSVSKMLAQHRSHSSHSSHRSSSSGGSSAKPQPQRAKPKRAQPQPTPQRQEAAPSNSRSSDPLGQSARPEGSYPPDQRKADQEALKKALSDKEARKNVIMRVQLTLQFLELYDGEIDGEMGPKTRKAVLQYKKIKGIPGDSLLDVDTLNALGIAGF